jgi:hypothetical protein
MCACVRADRCVLACVRAGGRAGVVQGDTTDATAMRRRTADDGAEAAQASAAPMDMAIAACGVVARCASECIRSTTSPACAHTRARSLAHQRHTHASTHAPLAAARPAAKPPRQRPQRLSRSAIQTCAPPSTALAVAVQALPPASPRTDAPFAAAAAEPTPRRVSWKPNDDTPSTKTRTTPTSS